MDEKRISENVEEVGMGNRSRWGFSGTGTDIQIRKGLEMEKPAWRLQILRVALGIVQWYGFLETPLILMGFLDYRISSGENCIDRQEKLW